MSALDLLPPFNAQLLHFGLIKARQTMLETRRQWAAGPDSVAEPAFRRRSICRWLDTLHHGYR